GLSKRLCSCFGLREDQPTEAPPVLYEMSDDDVSPVMNKVQVYRDLSDRSGQVISSGRMGGDKMFDDPSRYDSDDENPWEKHSVASSRFAHSYDYGRSQSPF